MTLSARILSPALRTYRGDVTKPERWASWTPREGDILVCTPPKCGTTWTQTMLTMLVHGGTDLPDKVPVLSPWVDADLGVPQDVVAAALDAQSGRRVVKTHTPADGFPVWVGVTVIAVYRHPLDVYFSLRKHMANTREQGPEDEIWMRPVSESLPVFLDGKAAPEDFDQDTLATLCWHYRETALSGRLPNLKLFHYSDMLRDGRQTVAALARAAGIDAGAGLIDRVAEATAFSAMKAQAASYAPVAGTGYWKSDAAFFDSANSGKWEGQLSAEEVELYSRRIGELVPDEAARHWLENGSGAVAPE